MLVKLFSDLSIPASTSVFSQAVALGDANAVQFNMDIHSIASAVAVTITLQGSNDMENWALDDTITFNATADAVGAFLQTTADTGLGTTYIRAVVTTGAASAILGLSVNLSRQ